LDENETAVGKGNADIIDREAGLTANSIDANITIQPEPDRDVADSMRRPPREHFRLKRETGRSPGPT
jgi:hypothetical protein